MAKKHFLIIGPLIALLIFALLKALAVADSICYTAAITSLCAVWWVTEAIPIAATSLLPFALFPLFGVLDRKVVATALGDPMIILLMGAFMLSKSLERSGVHKRLALYMIRLVGGNDGRHLVLGFMLAAAFLSMWISNTATTLMLIPIALAILDRVADKQLHIALILGIAYAASLGGVGTPIGTPPNIIFMGVYEQTTGVEVGFYQWMLTGVPIVIIGIPLMALWLTRKVNTATAIELPESGSWQLDEKRVLWVFVLTALAWMTRKLWTDALGLNGVGDDTVALIAVAMLFLIPNGKGEGLLDWKTAESIPWGMLLLFAGGIAIAKAFMASGLSQLLGEILASATVWPLIALIVVICLSVSFLTEITSNTATTTLLMPILASAGVAANIDPGFLMIPAAISASCAFMLPVATAPNAIAYATGKFPIKTMIREGIVLNLVLVVIISAACYFTL